jgi:hypothetical protein
MNVLNYLNTDITKNILTLFSIVFGIVQYVQKRGIKHLISFEAAALHKNVGKALGAIQGAQNNTGESKEHLIGMAEGINQALLIESAKLFCNLRDTTIDDIDELIKNDQLPEKYREFYYSFSKRKIGAIRRLGKWISKIY